MSVNGGIAELKIGTASDRKQQAELASFRIASRRTNWFVNFRSNAVRYSGRARL